VWASQALAAKDMSAEVGAALKARLPRTKISAIDCSKLPGMCEVTAGQTLFYTDRSARYMVIGRIYDMETRADLTAARLLEMNPDLLVAGAPRVAGSGGEARTRSAGQGQQTTSKVDLSALPQEGAIRWGKGPDLLTIFTDLRCSYCARLSEVLASMPVAIEERPISTLGSRKLSERVYCAVEPAKALHRAYRGDDLSTEPQRADCNTAGLDANEQFARRVGFSGTPVMVRSDGVVLQGLRSADQLAAWISEGKAALENSDWMVALQQKPETIADIKASQRLDMDHATESLIRSLKRNGVEYSELLIKGPEMQALGRLCLDPWSAKVYSSSPEDFAEIERLTQAGYSIEQAIDILSGTGGEEVQHARAAE